MVSELKYRAGPVSIGAAGTHQFLYTQDPKGKAVKIDNIQAAITSGTQTGVVRFRLGTDGTNLNELSRSSLTAAAPSHRIPGDFILHPGMVLSIDFSGVTAADQVTCFIGGH